MSVKGATGARCGVMLAVRAVGTINVLGSELGRPVLQVGIQGKDLVCVHQSWVCSLGLD